MIDKLLKFLGRTEDLPEEECIRERIEHATAVLLVEIARADHDLHEAELVEMRDQLAQSFDLAEQDFKQAVKLDKSLIPQVPNLKDFRDLAMVFRGKNKMGAGTSDTEVLQIPRGDVAVLKDIVQVAYRYIDQKVGVGSAGNPLGMAEVRLPCLINHTMVSDSRDSLRSGDVCHYFAS